IANAGARPGARRRVPFRGGDGVPAALRRRHDHRDHDQRDPDREPPVRAMKEWRVAGALLEPTDLAGHLLLVRNQRRGGHTDWSTPGGVIDDTDADVLAGLTREVQEETGLRVTAWEGPLYEV